MRVHAPGRIPQTSHILRTMLATCVRESAFLPSSTAHIHAMRLRTRPPVITKLYTASEHAPLPKCTQTSTQVQHSCCICRHTQRTSSKQLRVSSAPRLPPQRPLYLRTGMPKTPHIHTHHPPGRPAPVSLGAWPFRTLTSVAGTSRPTPGMSTP